jgi:hypothetical protein
MKSFTRLRLQRRAQCLSDELEAGDTQQVLRKDEPHQEQVAVLSRQIHKVGPGHAVDHPCRKAVRIARTVTLEGVDGVGQWETTLPGGPRSLQSQ